MTYKELQKRATQLGLKAVGQTAEALEASIKEAEAKGTGNQATQSTVPPTENQNKKDEENPGGDDSTPPASSPEVPSASEPEKPKKEKAEKPNTAVVYDGKREVRRYTVELHGEDFVKLASEFAKGRGYTVEEKYEDLPQNCRNCGATLKCQNCGVVVK